MDFENFMFFFPGLFIGTFVVAIIAGIFIDYNFDGKIILDKEVANDVCFHLTNKTGVIGNSSQGKLICNIPSFDSTQNIIIRGGP